MTSTQALQQLAQWCTERLGNEAPMHRAANLEWLQQRIRMIEQALQPTPKPKRKRSMPTTDSSDEAGA